MQKCRILILFLMLIPFAAISQTPSEYAVFAESAGSKSILYRGPGPKKYNFLYNGHYFWDSRDYKPGSVCFNGRVYDNVLLNIDAYGQQLLTRADVGSVEVNLLRDYVEWFEIGGERFLNLRRDGVITNAEPGFYAVKKSGKNPIFFRVSKFLSSNMVNNNNGYSGIGYVDENYRSDVYTCFMIYRQYYTVRNDKLVKIGRRKAEKLINEK